MNGMPAPDFGRRLLPTVLDELALTDPNRILYSYTKTNNPADGFHDLTTKTFARAVDRCAWFIHNHLGRGENFPTVTYIGPQDLVYGILTMACVKTGYKILLTSTRNTLQAHLSLFEKTDCNTFLCPPNFKLPIVKQILAARQMHVLEVPTVDHWIQDTSNEHDAEPSYPYDKTFSEARREPFVVLHTSGTTGLPKPIIQTNGTVAIVDALNSLPALGHPATFPALCGRSRQYTTFPLFHAAGITLLLPAAIFNEYTLVLGPFPPSVETVNAMIVHGNVEYVALAPTTLVEMVKDPTHLDDLRRLKQILYGGGPCPPEALALASQRTTVTSVIGSTECGVFAVLPADPEDFGCMNINPLMGVEYRHVSGDLYEQVVVRKPELDLYQGVFQTFPELTEWRMKDLYSKHPTKPGVWHYQGRMDDIIVFSTGEKLNPIDMEATIAVHPEVNGVLVAGAGRFQTSLLIEAATPPTTYAQKAQLLDQIWPAIEAANKESPSHARIHRNMVLFTYPSKPVPRAGKGTIQRKLTLDLYAPDLHELYESTKELANGTADRAETTTNGVNGNSDANAIVKRIIAASTEIEVEGLHPDANLFELGLDSLQVTQITREINQFLSRQKVDESIEPRDVYANNSLRALAGLISAHTSGKVQEIAETDEQKMQKLFKLYTSALPLSEREPQPYPTNSFTVLITGTTGSLGTYLLSALLSDSRVDRIYCLNRGPNSFERQQKSLAAKGLPLLPPRDDPSSRVEVLDSNLVESYFGLTTDKYKKLLKEVTTVIHNAWKVDFNLSIDSFTTQVDGTRHMVDFSAHSRLGARIFFVSSISSVSNANGHSAGGVGAEIPEKTYEDLWVPQPMGYGQSKFTAERLLNAAAQIADVPAVICRVGQIAGPTGEAGVWPKQEWLPSLIASSKYLGKLPVSLGQMDTVDWIPVDVLARGLLELALGPTNPPGSCAADGPSGAAVYHAVNPQRTSWPKLVQTVAATLDQQNPEHKIELVPLKAWVEALRESASKIEDIPLNPAVKLLDFFQGMSSRVERKLLLDTRRTVASSKTLATVGPIREAWMANWVRQWAF